MALPSRPCRLTFEVDAAARIQIDNRQLEIGYEFTPPPLASNDLLGIALVRNKFVVFRSQGATHVFNDFR